MNIKVCGITQLKQMHQLEGLDIDFAGMVFYKESVRYAGDKISGSEVKEADFDLRKVGVFVNQSYDEIMATIEDYGLDVVQLHGDESPDLCEELSENTEVIKAFRIPPGNSVHIDKMVQPYDSVCDYYLFDTGGHKESFGGTGQQFDWDLLSKSKIEKPFFLSGGIGLEDVQRIRAIKHPDFYAVDLNSKFERSPGIKDMALLLQFIQSLKKALKS